MHAGSIVIFSSCLLATAAPALLAEEQGPSRVVSMNLCTDQLAMLVAKPGQLFSVSDLAADPLGSVLAEQARGIPVNHGFAEEVLVMKPDLVLATVFTPRATVALLRRMGLRVEQFAPESSLEDIRTNVRKMGHALGRSPRAEEIVAVFDRELALVRGSTSPGAPLAALYYSQNLTSGAKTLGDDVVSSAGLRNLSRELGLRGMARLTLETVMMAEPDVLVTGHKPSNAPALAYENFQHPAMRRLLLKSQQAPVPDKYWICGGPFTIEAVRLLAESEKSSLSRKVNHADHKSTSVRP